MSNQIMIISVDSNKNPQIVLTDKGTRLSVREIKALLSEERDVKAIDSKGVITGVKANMAGISLPQDMKEFDV